MAIAQQTVCKSSAQRSITTVVDCVHMADIGLRSCSGMKALSRDHSCEYNMFCAFSYVCLAGALYGLHC